MVKSHKILHIEDNHEFNSMLYEFFKKFYPVECFIENCPSLSSLESFTNNYDAVITDLWLENRNWIKTVEIVLSKFSCPVIILSNLSSNLSERLFREQGVYFFYSKDELRKNFPEKIYNIISVTEKEP